MPFRFEGLQIWNQARAFSNRIYKIVARFPDSERFSLMSQMTRAANSVGLNIAEGSGRDTNLDFNRFLGIAVASLFEVVAASYIALDCGYIDSQTHAELYSEAQRLAKAINSFRKTIDPVDQAQRHRP